MEAIKYRYRYQAKHTFLLLVHDESGHHISEALYDGPIRDFGVKMPVKWEEDADDTASSLTNMKVPEGFRVVIWPANEREERKERGVSFLRSMEDVRTWIDVESIIYDGYDNCWDKAWDWMLGGLNNE